MSLRSIRLALRNGLLVPLCIIAGSLHASGDLPWSSGKINFEMTGTVIDAVTKQPIEGAYVVASYRELHSGWAATASWCVKTRGMYTGKDGRYRFPVEKLDGRSPFDASAIKPGYYRGSRSFPDDKTWEKQGPDAYSGRDLLLNPQDPAKPNFRLGYGDEYCTRAKTKEDAAAGAEFLKIEMAEYIRFGAGDQAVDNVREMIRHLETIREVPASK